VNILEKQLKSLDDMETWTSTTRSTGAKIAKEIGKIRETANVQIEQLRSCLDALRQEVRCASPKLDPGVKRICSNAPTLSDQRNDCPLLTTRARSDAILSNSRLESL
jgi:hypothetical protein